MASSTALSVIILFLFHPPQHCSSAFSSRLIFKHAGHHPLVSSSFREDKSNTDTSATVLFSNGGRDAGRGRGRGRGAGRGRGRGRDYRGETPKAVGHDYIRIGDPTDPSICHLEEDEIHKLIRERVQCRRARDFQQADEIRERLRQNGVDIDDKSKKWRADGKEAYKLGIPRFGNCQSIEEAVEIAYGYQDLFTPRDLSAFWTVIARLLPNYYSQAGKQHDQPELMQQLNSTFSQTMDQMGMYGPRDLTQTTLAFAKIVSNVDVGERGQRAHSKGSHHEILRILFLRQKETIFQSLSNATYPRLHQFDGRCLSNLAYAYALAEFVPKLDDEGVLFDHLGDKSIDLLDTFTPQGLSNIVWSFAKTEISHAQLFEAVADHIVAVEHAKPFKPQELSNVVWSFAKAGISHPSLFEKISEIIVSSDVLDSFKPQGLSNLVWSFAKAKVSNSRLFDEVSGLILSYNTLDSFMPQSLSNIVWAFAKAGVSQPLLFEKVADHIVTL